MSHTDKTNDMKPSTWQKNQYNGGQIKSILKGLGTASNFLKDVNITTNIMSNSCESYSVWFVL